MVSFLTVVTTALKENYCFAVTLPTADFSTFSCFKQFLSRGNFQLKHTVIRPFFCVNFRDINNF